MIVGLLATIGVSFWGASRALEAPTITPVRRPTAEDAARAQQKLFRLVRGSASEPIAMSEAEINAFVSRNVDPRDLPFDRPTIVFHDGDILEIVGEVPLARLLADSPLGFVGGLLPERWRARPVWIQVAAHARLERRPRTQLRLDVQRMAIGRQRVPTLALRLLFDPARLRFVRLVVPETVTEIRIQSGRVLIRPASSRERT